MAKRIESFVRWQATAIAQMGYAVNLFLGLATASLGFLLVLVRDPRYVPGRLPGLALALAAILLLASVTCGLFCVVNRLCDFRLTRRIAKLREDWERDPRLQTYRRKTNALGKRTWNLFWRQVVSFLLGVLLLVTSLEATYWAKLFCQGR